MEKRKTYAYESPQVEVIEVEVEQGFAVSTTATTSELPTFEYEEGF